MGELLERIYPGLFIAVDFSIKREFFLWDFFKIYPPREKPCPYERMPVGSYAFFVAKFYYRVGRRAAPMALVFRIFAVVPKFLGIAVFQ